MEADSGFVRNVRSPGSSDLVIKVNGKDVNRYDEEPEESMIFDFPNFFFLFSSPHSCERFFLRLVINLQ